MRTTLLIMAAGLGSRFGGGIKQLEPVGMNDEIIMDYSIHDAIKAGFNKIIFVIRKDIEQDFRERIGNRIEALCNTLHVETGYAFQDKYDIPEGFEVPENRMKPWGTGQAVLAARHMIKEPFIVINADDYYGKEAFYRLHEWLTQEHADTTVSMAAFILKNTLSEHGGVTRGVCYGPKGHTHITNVVETRNIIKTDRGIEADGVLLDPDTYVSMNMWGFPAKEGKVPPFVSILENEFISFFREIVPADPLKSEYLLPVLIGRMLKEGCLSVKVLETQDKWFGVTYQEDKVYVKENIKKLIADGIYQKELYSDLLDS